MSFHHQWFGKGSIQHGSKPRLGMGVHNEPPQELVLPLLQGGGDFSPDPLAQAGFVALILCSESLGVRLQAWQETRPGGREGPER